MSTSFQMPDEIPDSSGNFLSVPGTYHCLITEVKDGQGQKGTPIDGFTLTFHVLAGTTPDCAGKTHTESVFSPKLTAKDGGKFQSQQHAALYVATDLVDPSKRGQRVEIDRNAMTDRQLVIKFEKDTHNSEGDKTFLRISGLGIYHVDDPRVEKVPKDQDAIALLQPRFRHERAWFDSLITKKSSSGQTAGAGAGTGAGAGASNVDLSDL